MHLAFESKELRAICESHVEAIAQLGEDAAGLQRRLADLEAATSVADLVAGQPEFVNLPEGERTVVHFSNGRRLLLAANHVKIPVKPDGHINWGKVMRVRLVRIE